MWEHIYELPNGTHRKYAIFAPGIDRFILVDNYDLRSCLETAEILSSKLPTVSYVMPNLDFEINTDNCINYTIFNKTEQKYGIKSILITRQVPMNKFLLTKDTLSFEGIPADYDSEEGRKILEKLTNYAKFVHDRVYVLMTLETFMYLHNNANFINKYIPSSWSNDFLLKHDWSDADKGVVSEIRHALYISQSIEEAEERIKNIWARCANDQWRLMVAYYKDLSTPIPEDLQHLINALPQNFTPYMF